MRKCVTVVCVVLGWLAGFSPARAADLRVSFDEILKLTQPLTATAKMRLHNVPPSGVFGGMFASEEQSYFKFGATSQELPLTAYTFSLSNFGTAKYAYYFNDINTSSISLSSQNGALRISVRFEEDRPELVGACYSGACAIASALPVIEWRKPGVDIDLRPIKHKDGVSLAVKKVTIRGYFQTICRSGSILCSLGRSWAQRQINRSRSTEMPRQITKILDSDMNREKIAAIFATFLRIGASGQIKIKTLAVEPKLLRVNFEF